MNRTLIVALVVLCSLSLLLPSCAQKSSVQLYRPADRDGPQWKISGNFNEFTNNVVIKINADTVLEGIVASGDEVSTFRGNYRGREVQTTCDQTVGLWNNSIECQVYVEGEVAATLKFPI